MVGLGVRNSRRKGNSRRGAAGIAIALAVSRGGVVRESDWTGPHGFNGQKSPLVGEGISREHVKRCTKEEDTVKGTGSA